MNQRKTERKGRVHSTISNKLTIHNCEEQWMCIKYGSGDMIEIISFSLIGVLFFCHGIYLILLHYLFFFSFDCSHIHCSNHYFMTTKKIMAESS